MFTFLRIHIFGIILLFFVQSSFSQSDGLDKLPYVKPNVISFTNFHYSSRTDSSAFQQEKLMLGVSYQFNENWSGSFRLDIIRHDDRENPQRLTPFVKPGFISYHKNKFTVDAGIMLASQFNDQLRKWGNRYLLRTFQDKQSFGWSNDLGIRARYEIFDNFQFEAGIFNGAGYRHIGLSFPLKYTSAIYYSPTENWFFKVYSDVYRKNVPQSTLASFVDYRANDKYSFSLEYNYKWNYKFIPGHNRHGVSAYSTIHFLDKFAFISRLDQLYLNNKVLDNPEFTKPINDTLYLLGFQYQPLKQIRIAVDYQLWRYYEELRDEEPWFYVHLEYRIM